MSKQLFLATFEREEDILAATKAVCARKYEIHEVYTPYAVHGLDSAMGLKPTRLPLICLAFGLLGAAAKLWFQVWTSATSWPVNVGGKPMSSVPAFVPVTFEVTVLFAGLGTVAAFFLLSRLRPGKKPVLLPDRATNDAFVLVLVERDASFDLREVTAFLRQYNCVKTEERYLEEAD